MSTGRQTTAQIGGIPTVGLDVPVCGVFIGLFVALAAAHMTLFQRNKRRGHKFVFNGLLFGFAMSRILANVMRLVWATQPTNIDVSLVASVFLNAGILLVYVLNNLLAWRLVRSAAPRTGWHPVVRIGNKVMLWGVLTLIVPLIVIIVLRVKQPTLAHITTASTVVSRLAQTYFLIIALSPFPLIALAVAKAKGGSSISDPMGTGPWSVKVGLLVLTTALAAVEAGFRCGTAWTHAPPASSPAWWDAKPAFYCFNFTMDVLLLVAFLIGRIDQRFHVPNGSSKRATYVTSEGMPGSPEKP